MSCLLMLKPPPSSNTRLVKLALNKPEAGCSGWKFLLKLNLPCSSKRPSSNCWSLPSNLREGSSNV